MTNINSGQWKPTAPNGKRNASFSGKWKFPKRNLFSSHRHNIFVQISMNTSQFMDKQIMEFSGLQTTGDLSSDLLNTKEDHGHQSNDMEGGTIGSGGGSGNLPVEEEIEPSYDFQLIHTNVGPHVSPPVPQPQAVDYLSSSSRNYGLVEPNESSTPIQEQNKDFFDAIMIAEIDRAVKNHFDNLLCSVEGISSRLTQLETRTHQLENSMDCLKISFGETVGITDGKLRQLENILIEIQTGIQVLRGKQVIAEAHQHPQLQAQASSDAQQLPASLQQPFQQPSEATVPSQQHPTVPAFPASPQQSFQQPHQLTVLLQQHPAAPVQSTPQPVIPVPTPQQNLPVQFPGAVPQTQIPSIPTLAQQRSFPSPGQQQESTYQQYQSPVQQPAPSPHQQEHYQQASHLPQYPPPTALVQSPLAHNPEGPSPYMLNQTYSPMFRPPLLSSQSPSGSPSPQFYGPSSNMYDPPTSRPGSGPQSYPLNYGAPPVPGFQEPHNYSDSPSHYSMKPSPFASSSIQSGRGSNYQRLPTAKVLPQATSVGSGSGGSTGNRVPIDDVVDKVATMGFSREQVRETVKKLTENGQSVDLNVVLDKLMNGGERGY